MMAIVVLDNIIPLLSYGSSPVATNNDGRKIIPASKSKQLTHDGSVGDGILCVLILRYFPRWSIGLPE